MSVLIPILMRLNSKKPMNRQDAKVAKVAKEKQGSESIEKWYYIAFQGVSL